ncbi:MAG: hypothetical protein QHH06_15435 [Clostridiales bacterium]|nr:hypothetical protein [Eubacteriales bacterium]MDH7567828.1 hypothetical protein [Clostridiales bacterium]
MNKSMLNDIFSMLLYIVPFSVSLVFWVAAVAGRLEYMQKKMKYSTLKQKTGTLKRMAKIRFTGKLPETFKMLNSRYMSRGSIQEAIWTSLEDMDKAVRKEMKKVYDTLNTNSMEEIDNTFNMIESFYRNEYLTLLLNLIRQAHYKGGSIVIKEQFEVSTEEILSEIERSKDLSATSRSYILLSLFMPVGLLGIEYFNRVALGNAADQFYASPMGIGIKIVFFVSLVLYIGYLLYLEKIT